MVKRPRTRARNAAIDSYREKAFFGYRLIELFDDHVVVSGYRAFGTDFKLNVPLRTLEPNISHLGIREQTRLIGLILFIGGTIGALAWESHPPIYRNVGFWVCSFFAVFGLVLLIRSFRRIETAAFYTSAGVARLTISRIGPDIGRYQDFVDHISSQIALCRAAHP